MEAAILGHLRRELVKNYALLTPLTFKHVRNDLLYIGKLASEIISVYNDFLTYICLKRQTIILPSVIYYQFDDRNEEYYPLEIKIEDKHNQFRSIDYKNGIVHFNFVHNNIFNYFTYDDSVIKLNTSTFPYYDNGFTLTYDGKLLEIYDHGELTIKINEDMIKVKRAYNSEGIESSIIDESVVQEAKQFFSQTVKGELTLEFNSDNSIKRYGKFVDGGKQDLFYDSDGSGNFEISCYSHNTLHGFYFNSKTGEQGFYSGGSKVGFWKERGEIVNYDKQKVFFIFPVFVF